jgi:hypothetical protein
MSGTFTPQANSGEHTWNSIAVNAAGNIMYATYTLDTSSNLIKSTDSGVTWNIAYTKVYDPNVGNQLTNIYCSSSGDVVAVGNLGTNLILISTDGTTFTEKEIPNTANFLSGNSSGDVIYSFFQYNVYKSTNYGDSWINITPSGFSGEVIGGGISDYSGKVSFATSPYVGDKVYVYTSINNGTSWTKSSAITYPGINNNGISLTSNSATGEHLYLSIGGNQAVHYIYSSSDSGVTWTQQTDCGENLWTSIVCDSTGQTVNMMNDSGDGALYTSIDYGVTWTHQYIPGIPYLNILSSNSNSLTLLLGVTGGINYLWTYSIPPPPPPPICFKEGSTLLSFINGKEEYVPIENIRAGTLVKTYLHGYVPVHSIGTSKIYNSGDKLRGKNRLYRLSKDKYPELTEDLIITGCHCVLVDRLNDKQRADIMEDLGMILVTDRKGRLMAMYDDRADTYEEEGTFNIWHLALEHDDERMNYGVYANGGLLVETTSQRMLANFSGMTLM